MELKVIENRIENRDCFSIVFEKPNGFSFYPGQYIDITLAVKNRNIKPFTISASPTEKYIMITAKAGISQFKKKLKSLKEGDTVNISHPAGTFVLDENSPAVMIAGGIGITPFRSMIKYAVDKKLKTPLTLLYSNSTLDFPFKKELDALAQTLPSLKIIYNHTSQDGRLAKERLSQLQTPNYKLQTIFYIAGPVKMMEDIRNVLLSMGIPNVNMRTDEFTGY